MSSLRLRFASTSKRGFAKLFVLLAFLASVGGYQVLVQPTSTRANSEKLDWLIEPGPAIASETPEEDPCPGEGGEDPAEEDPCEDEESAKEEAEETQAGDPSSPDPAPDSADCPEEEAGDDSSTSPGSGSPAGILPSAIFPRLPKNSLPTATDDAPVQRGGSGSPYPKRQIDSPHVKARSGELTWKETDVSLKGIGIDLHLTRTYTSKGYFQVGILGAGWAINLDKYLKADSGYPGAGNQITPLNFVSATGSGKKSFPWQRDVLATGDWYVASGQRARFEYTEEDRNGAWVGILTKFRPDGIREQYETLISTTNEFHLVSVYDPSGNTISYSWIMGPHDFYVLDEIVDTVGRKLTFKYVGAGDDYEGFLEGVDVISSTGATLGSIAYLVEVPGGQASGNQVPVLSKVTGLEIGTENQSQGGHRLLAPERQYVYELRYSGTMALLQKVVSARNGVDVIRSWRYDTISVDWRVSEEFHGDLDLGARHHYDWSSFATGQGGLMTYEGPEGVKRLFTFDAKDRIISRIDGYDPQNTEHSETLWEYTTGPCCDQITRITYPSGMRQEFQYDADGNVEYVWRGHPDESWRVERFSWSTFDPSNGQMFLRLEEKDLIRDALDGEDPENHCVDGTGQNEESIPGLVRHSYTWDSKGRMSSIDFGDYYYDVEPSAQFTSRTTSFQYFDDASLPGTDQIYKKQIYFDGVLVSETEYGLDSNDQFIEEAILRDPVNGGQWTWSWTLDGWGRIIEDTGPDGIVTKWEYDPASNLLKESEDWDQTTSTGSRTTERFYDLAGLMAKRVTTSGTETEKVEYFRNALGRVTERKVTGTDGVARSTEYEFDLLGNPTLVRDWRGMELNFVYALFADRALSKITQTYNSNTRTLWKAGDGSDPGYDLAGRLTSSRDSIGLKSYLSYDSFGRVKNVYKQVDANHFARELYLYDSRGFVKEVEEGMVQGTHPLSPIQLQWNRHRIVKRNRAGHVLAIRVYEDGAAEPARATTYEIDWRGLPTLVRTYHGDRANGAAAAKKRIHHSKWDALGRPILSETVLDPVAGTTTRSTSITYEETQRRVVRETIEEDGLRSKTQTQFDELWRSTSRTQWAWENGAWGTSRTFLAEYDGLDRRIATVDPLGRRFETIFDGLGRPLQKQRLPITVGGNPGEIHVTHYAWNASTGVLESVTDAEGSVTSFTYHNSHFLLPKKVIYPDGRYDEITEYDGLDRPTKLIDSRHVEHQISYDGFYRVEDKAIFTGYPDVVGPDRITWEYDSMTGVLDKSKVWQGTTQVWETDVQINPLGELLSETQGLGADAHSWSWTYGFAGELYDTTYPTGLGFSDASWTYDDVGRMDVLSYKDGPLTIGSFDLTYQGSRLTGLTEGISGIAETLSFDGFGRLNSMLYEKPGSGILEGQTRAFDLSDRVIAEHRAIDFNASQDPIGEVYEHDGHGRMEGWFEGVVNPLSHAPGTTPSTWSSRQGFELNNVFGRESVEYQTQGSGMTTETYTANSAHAYLGIAGGPNAQTRIVSDGLLKDDGQFLYYYDAWRRLAEVKDKATQNVLRTFIYDAEGRRVRSIEPGETRRYLYWNWNLAAEYVEGASGPESIRTYAYVGMPDGEDLVRQSHSPDPADDGTWFIARDFQGSFTAMIDQASGQVDERYRYSPFGAVTIEDGAGVILTSSGIGNQRFFLGRPFDAGLGLFDLRARWYDPGLGTFLSPDPLGAVDSWNFYQYGLATPCTLADPFGLQSGPARLYDCYSCHVDMSDVYPWKPGDVTVLDQMKDQARRIQRGVDHMVSGGLVEPNMPYLTPDELYAAEFTAMKVWIGMAIIEAGLAGGGAAARGAGAAGRFRGLSLLDDAVELGDDAAKAAAKCADDVAEAAAKKSGSYTNKHASGKAYHGKGSRARSQESGRRIANEYDDPHTSTDWTPAANSREAFKDEARRISGDPLGAKDPRNYNKVNSPGKKYLEQDRQ
ncbi:MAG: RHS repeat-associated core domain-containing protein [Planctomycetota bacterium]|nr:MAG: RHS repeat-associated core domain-containing protein [Planctomycetota bacterium]